MVVDVWVVERGTRPTAQGLATLDGPERERAAALPDGAAQAFVLGRVLLRVAVAARWACPAAQVQLRATCPVCGGPHGPVRVLGPGPARPAGRPSSLHVSVTRAGPVVAVALCADAPVGLDAESRAAVAAAPLADVALSPDELARWAALADLPGRGGRRRRALASAWVRKEATLKALGTGLAVAPADVRLHRPRRGVGAGLRGVDAVTSSGVAVADLRLGPGRVGAVAVVAPALLKRSTGGLWRGSGALVVRRYDGVRLLAGRRS